MGSSSDVVDSHSTGARMGDGCTPALDDDCGGSDDWLTPATRSPPDPSKPSKRGVRVDTKSASSGGWSCCGAGGVIVREEDVGIPQISQNRSTTSGSVP